MKAKEHIKESLEEIKRLEDLFDDRIVELANVKGGQLDRQVILYYRSILWGMRDNLHLAFDLIKEK